MAIITLPLDVNVTPGGIWAIASEDVACAAFVSVSGNTLTITEPVTTSCNIILTYTVTSGACQDISTHEVQITPKTCISIDTGIAIPSDWQLNLAPLTINGALQDNFAYAIVPENDDCTTYNNAVAWGYKGSTCLDVLPDDTTPKTDFDALLPITTFQVPAGDYKLVVVCSDHTLGTCEKIDCCGVNVTVTDLDLCSETALCNAVHVGYETAGDFTIYIPMLVIKGKCVRFDFDGGGSFADRIYLDVNTGTIGSPIWTPVDLDTFSGNTYVSTSQYNSIVVRCDTAYPLINPILNVPILPVGSTEITAIPTNKYQLRWTVKRDASGGTKWSVGMSCCDCLDTCPPIIYNCITNVIEDPIPSCTNNCNNITVYGNHGYSVDEIFGYIAGDCIGTNTCLGTVANSSLYSSEINGASPSNTYSFTHTLGLNYNTVAGVSLNLCADKQITTLSNPENNPIIITTSPAGTYTINFGTNADHYTNFKNMIDTAMSGNLTNKVLLIDGMRIYGSLSDCGDTSVPVGYPPSMYFAQNGNRVSVSYPGLNVVEFSGANLEPIGVCTNLNDTLLNNIPIEPEVFVCGEQLPVYTKSAYIFTVLSGLYYATITEIEVADGISIKFGNYGVRNLCPALFQQNYFYIVNKLDVENGWILVESEFITHTCGVTPILARRILQYGSGLTPGTTYSSYTPIVGCVNDGWKSGTISYVITPDTTVGNCI